MERRIMRKRQGKQQICKAQRGHDEGEQKFRLMDQVQGIVYEVRQQRDT